MGNQAHWNLNILGADPTENVQTDDVYLNDGTLTPNSKPGFRRRNATSWEDVGGAAGEVEMSIQEIARVVLTTTQTTISFTSIPSTFEHLRLMIYCESDISGVAQDGMNVAFNSDTTASNYTRVSESWQDSARIDNDAADRAFGSASGATSSANAFAYNIVDMPFYSGTVVFKAAFTGAMRFESISDNNARQNTLQWENTAAINRIDLTNQTGDFVADSKFVLYGVN